MLTRLRPLLDNKNLECMYTTFIRPIMEYGSVQFMGAASTHLAQLDQNEYNAPQRRLVESQLNPSTQGAKLQLSRLPSSC